LFYCHFPDQLLATDRRSLAKQLYRKPLDMLEEYTTGQAHRILVNSKFTAGVFAKTFTSLHAKPDVLYPSINFTAFDASVPADPALVDWIPPRYVFTRRGVPPFGPGTFIKRARLWSEAKTLSVMCCMRGRAKTVLLSINRYERKKNVGLAIEALACLKAMLAAEEWSSLQLVIAGVQLCPC
jgi:alpha-1,3/alpha-1,6-mannosyltransferase